MTRIKQLEQELAATRAVFEDLLLERGPSSLVFAEFDTPNFSFRVFGHSEEECRQLMARAWRRHAEQSGADPGYFIEDELYYVRVALGDVLLDGEVMRFRR